MSSEILSSMLLQRTLPMNAGVQCQLVNALGSATAVYENRKDLSDALPEATPHLIELLSHMDDHRQRVEEEMAFVEKNKIQCLCLNDEKYPKRLSNCPDAPILLYYLGNSDLNTRHIINMVGTRHCTEYGKQLCADFLRELKALVPDVLVVSGLAYGIDINAHREALKNGLQTVGVLAHGLDQIYPRLHRDTAIEMTKHGGLLTEFMSRSTAEKVNFVSRNRIVAGIAEATIVVESKSKGGSLITAGIANDYSRAVFAFPGRIGDELSAGCNKLIYDNKASLLLNAEDFVKSMGWTAQRRQQPIQQELFPTLTPQEQAIIDALKKSDGCDINQLAVLTNTPIPALTTILFDMELRGLVKSLNGGKYR